MFDSNDFSILNWTKSSYRHS